jgi:predicted NAD/FAD-dependent oxidoreductase
MTATQFNVAVLGASPAGVACARHLQSDTCNVTVYDAAGGADEHRDLAIRHGVSVFDIWHDQGWRLASLEAGVCADDYDVLVLALPAAEAAALLSPLLPATALQVAAMLQAEEKCIWLPAVQLGLCGDWMCGGGQGDGWLSGHALAARLLAQQGQHQHQDQDHDHDQPFSQNSVEAVKPTVRGAPSTR